MDIIKFSLLVFICLTIIGCKTLHPFEPRFEHGIKSGPTPWTSNVFEAEEEDFTFAIIADLTGREREGVYSTAVEQINRLEPTFVLSVGDLIEGATEDLEQLEKEWDWFDERTSRLTMPFFHLGGNHDLTNPVMRKFWKKRFGPRYYHFVYNDVLFLMMDSEDYEEKRMVEIYEARALALKIRSGEIEGNFADTEYSKMQEAKVGGMSQQQFEYYEAVLEKHQDVRWTFVLMHKPLWLREDDKGLSKLEAALEGRKYSVINGHQHRFSHRKRLGQDYTVLGTTGGGQAPDNDMAFDHFTMVRMAKEPVITHLKMDGVLDETGKMPKPYKKKRHRD